MIQETSYHNYAQLFKVLADETRLGIMRLLAKQDRTVGELAQYLGLPIARVSHHLAILRAEALIQDRREGKRIICSIPSMGSLLASGKGTRSSAIYDLLTLLDEERELPKPGDELVVFAASSLSRPFEEIALAFEEKTGLGMRFRFGPSHSLAAELASGQFADLFVASSREAVVPLEAKGLFHLESLFVRGNLALWRQEEPIKKIEELRKKSIRWVALANPALAPCGERAALALKEEGLWQEVQPRLLFGRDAAQALDVAEQNGGTAITSLAVLPSHGHRLVLEHSLDYAFASTRVSSRRPLAEAFVEFLEKNQTILKRYGLHL